MSDPVGHIFTQGAAQRIVKSTKAVEGRPSDLNSRETDSQATDRESYRLIITGNLAGGEKYTVNWFDYPSADISTTTTASVSELGTSKAAGAGFNLYFINLDAIGSNTHALQVGQPVRGFMIRRQDDGAIWFEGLALTPDDCDPAGSSSDGGSDSDGDLPDSGE